MLNILIVDDNKALDIQLYNYIKNNSNNINIIGLATNGKEALDFLKSRKIDIILLDLEMPEINGLELIKSIQETKKFRQTKIIVISSHIRLINEIYSKECIVEHIFIKPFDFSTLIQYINTIEIENMDIDIYNRIEKLLSNFDINTNTIGYNYLVDSIFLAIKEPSLLEKLNKSLYLEVSRKHNVSSNKVKWNIEKIIRSIIRYTNLSVIHRLFQYTNNPSPKVFIREIVREILTKNEI